MEYLQSLLKLLKLPGLKIAYALTSNINYVFQDESQWRTVKKLILNYLLYLLKEQGHEILFG